MTIPATHKAIEPEEKMLPVYELDNVSLFNEFKTILDQKKVRTVFQPIVSLTDGSVAGYEALSRGPEGSFFERPDILFSIAEKFDMLWELEFLCRTKALERVRSLIPDKMLFINVDPKIINDPRFQKGLTREILERYRLDASSIIFEITEKTAIEDYKSFRRTLDNYTSQGYKIAIDDTGSGYSGLNLLAETRPQYIKIDMALIRNIDKDAVKYALMKAFYDFCTVTNMKIIAEGIETPAELNTLIDIGIPYGQGYFLQKPAPEFLEISPKARDLIIDKNKRKKQEVFHTLATTPIGVIAMEEAFFTPTTAGCVAIDYFNANNLILGVAVVDSFRPVGLLMKNKFFAHLATQYGVAVYMNRPISLVMDRNPLIVDYYTPLDQVSKLALSRFEDNMYDYIIVTKDGKYYGTTTVKALLEKTTQLELTRAKYSNPLTGLPGNILIDEELKKVIEEKCSFGVLYFDIDNFKAYNDIYGFENGDKIITLTASIIQKHVVNCCCSAFVGHIGGDDFIAVVRNADLESICKKIIDEFDQRVQDFYTEEDKRRGSILAKNRHGLDEIFPIATLSIGVVTNRTRSFEKCADIGEVASNLKKKCKLIWKSCYLIE